MSMAILSVLQLTGISVAYNTAAAPAVPPQVSCGL